MVAFEQGLTGGEAAGGGAQNEGPVPNPSTGEQTALAEASRSDGDHVSPTRPGIKPKRTRPVRVRVLAPTKGSGSTRKDKESAAQQAREAVANRVSVRTLCVLRKGRSVGARHARSRCQVELFLSRVMNMFEFIIISSSFTAVVCPCPCPCLSARQSASRGGVVGGDRRGSSTWAVG